MKKWSAPPRPAVYAEKALVTSILDGTYPPGSNLPAERELAAQLGVTRPTLREALRALESDGWFSVQQGKPTRVKDFWREGGLNVLSDLVRYSEELPQDFILNLLEVRLAMAPAYGRAAVDRSPADVVAVLKDYAALPDLPEAFASFDWTLHYTLTSASRNPIYTLILNGFSGFYEQMACIYFAAPQARLVSRQFYGDLLSTAREADGERAEQVIRRVMQQSISFWKTVNSPAKPETDP